MHRSARSGIVRCRRVAIATVCVGAATCALPAAAQADGLIAAYDEYVVGKGFEIKLVNVATGLQIGLPAGVNTTDDELHPALSPDGRAVVFMRTKLQPKLNGDVVPPTERSLVMLDRVRGVASVLVTVGSPAGPVIRTSTPNMAWGIRPVESFSGSGRFFMARHSTVFNFGLGLQKTSYGSGSAPAGSTHEVTHAALGSVMERDTTTFKFLPTAAVWLSHAAIDNVSGALTKGSVELTTARDAPAAPQFEVGQAKSFGSETAAASHPFPRNGDNFTALALADGDDVDIQTISWPQEQTLTVAPSPITTDEPERMPAWSPPDGNQLGFVRTSSGRRKLVVFDLTPGIQNPLNAPLDIGAEPPTPQLRSYQSVWGGLSLALSNEPGLPTVICSAACIRGLPTLTGKSLVLKPSVTSTTPLQRIGIFVAQVTGTRTLLGRTVPRIRTIGRVPLGRTRKGINTFRWNGKVAGRRLKAGTYLLTYRALRKDRVLSTSDSIRFTVTKSGKVTQVRRQS